MNNRETGSIFEQKAETWLRKAGYQIICRNFRARTGEIDLIAKDKEYLCFIEVKYRASGQKGMPAESITPAKMRRITRTAQFYMLSHHIPQDTPCRFDAVVILGDEITLIKNAFDEV